MRVFVSGYWNQNLGDDLFLTLLCNRYPKVDFYIIAGSSAMHSFNNLSNLHRIRIPFSVKVAHHLQHKRSLHGDLSILQKEQVKVASRYDLYCELGGSLFIQPKEGIDSQYSMRQCILSKELPYVIIGSNFGPFYQQQQLDNYRHLFSKVSRIWFRDQYSMHLFNQLPNVAYAPDLVFAYGNKWLSNADEGYVVISVIDVKKRFGRIISHHYQLFLIRLIRYYISMNQPVVLMSFCDSEGDLEFAQHVKKQIGGSSLVKIVSHNNVARSLKIISNAHQMVATRYHAMILAWLYQKPTLVLSYSHKIDHVIQDLFPDQLCLPIGKLNQQVDIKSLEFNHPSDIKKIIQQTRKQLDDFDQYFEG